MKENYSDLILITEILSLIRIFVLELFSICNVDCKRTKVMVCQLNYQCVIKQSERKEKKRLSRLIADCRSTLQLSRTKEKTRNKQSHKHQKCGWQSSVTPESNRTV